MTKPLVAATLACATLLATAATPGRADTLTLKDGSLVSGTVKQVDGGYEVTLAAGGTRFVGTADVRRIKLDNSGPVDEATARERLASLRRSLDADRDPAHALDRVEQFISMNGDTAAAAEAQKDAAVWRDRRDRKMQRVGKQWLTADDRDRLLAQIAQRVEAIRGLMAAGSLDAANAQLREAAARLDPDNVSFLYLNGVLQHRRGQLAEAKRSFDGVAEQVPDHAPTLVNQALLLASFKRWPQAAQALEKAMAAAPNNRQVLDDAFAFSQLVPDSFRKSLAIERMMHAFVPQEELLEQQMAARGLYRLGGKWVDKAALDEAKKKLDERAAQKKQMEDDFAAAQSKMRELDEEIARTQRSMQSMEAERYVVDPVTHKVFERGLPAVYWDVERDLEQYQKQRRDQDTKVADLKKRAAAFERDAPGGPAAAPMTLIGEEGVPVLLPLSAAASRPADAAARPSDSGRTAPAATAPAAAPPALPPPGAPYRGPFAPPADDVAPATRPSR